MFALINYARFVNVNPDEALERTIGAIARFQHLETAVREWQRPLRHDPDRDGRVLESRQRGTQGLTKRVTHSTSASNSTHKLYCNPLGCRPSEATSPGVSGYLL